MTFRSVRQAFLIFLIAAILCPPMYSQSGSTAPPKKKGSVQSTKPAVKKGTTKSQKKKPAAQKKPAVQKKSAAQPRSIAPPAAAPAPARRAGRLMTASGELNVLFVYVQFPDDRYLPDSPNWPKGKPPAYMDATIDQTWSASPTKGSFADYFNQMSLNKFKITGKCVSAVTPHTRAWYLKNNKRRDFITQETLEQLDKDVDFAPYDHWKFAGEYNMQNVPDGIVDMVLMLWRNVCNDTADVRQTLDLVPGGEASLGYGGNYTVDNGARTIRTGYGGSGSGITAIHPMGGDLGSGIIWEYARHEFGHWLLGGNEYHTDLGTWGLVNGWGTPGECMNSFERTKLGWITPTTIDDISTPRVISGVTLPDYVTSGVAYRIKVPGGGPDEYYLLENHQRISPYDIPDNNVPTAKGLYVLLQKKDEGDAVGVVSAEGRFTWTVPQQLPNIYGGSGELPVFLRGAPDPVNGYSKRQYIPWTWKGAPQNPAAIHYYQDSPNGPVHKAPPAIFTGNGKDQFDLANAPVFSPSTNPSSDLHHAKDKVGFKITGVKDGVYTIDIYINTLDRMK